MVWIMLYTRQLHTTSIHPSVLPVTTYGNIANLKILNNEKDIIFSSDHICNNASGILQQYKINIIVEGTWRRQYPL